ncbi:NAC domain-containing protein 83-like [Silene latifolia]|uniref:NAC domain-containing protein 83-like n=1 Tax=Silene latifolia TaxID=37657 RepID=UPI003D786423
MENNHNILGKSLKRLPPGLRFHPTDEELLFEYLRCKVFDLSLPASIIPQIGFLNFDPWELPGNPEERRYFFSKKEQKNKKQRSKRMTRCGYWKASGSTKQISAPSTLNSMGMFTQGLKKSFVFYEGMPPNGRRTPWRMHEYSLDFNDEIQVQDWVIYNVYQKKRNEDMSDSSTLIVEQCSDNIICSSPTSSAYNAGPSTYYCSSPTSSSNSIYKPSSHCKTNYGNEGNSYYSP